MVFCNENYNEYNSFNKAVTILILIDGFLQLRAEQLNRGKSKHVTILILIDGFLQYEVDFYAFTNYNVTILILIDGFLQSSSNKKHHNRLYSHNPYFNRWFSAIKKRLK